MIEILCFDGCPNYDGLETRIRTLVARLGYDVPICVWRIASDAHTRLADPPRTSSPRAMTPAPKV
jgi:hypothetical protein